ncbi:hypothetical protein Bca52824_096275 [Brassica carinata]|uniref:Uncharacterized protein n=1 Tax=Brassica carinata TaxID=52824 RepID=A0A8X7P0X6_BRACI|nr:hypothetical protein Bca52824_096275 [Brassica carinata]
MMLFKDISLGPHETQLRFRLIHFWEAWNPIKKTIIGLEMILIDEQAARDFCKKFKTYENKPTVLLVTTVNAKSIGGTFALTSMSSTRVFMDYDVQPTRDYLGCLDARWSLNAEPMTIKELFSYIKQESAQEAFFECTATIDDVVHGSPWYRAKISVYDNSDQAVLYFLVMLVVS